MATPHRIDISNPKVMRELVSKLVANTPVAYIVLDKSLRVWFMNDYFLKMRKLDKDSILGGYCYDVSNAGVPCAQCTVREAMTTGGKCFTTRKDILPDGSPRFVDDYAVPLKDENGDFEYILEIMINRTPEMLLKEKNNEVFIGIVNTLTSILDKKDAYTSTHSRDVTMIASKLAKYAGMNDDDLFELRLASLLHDIGKVYIPDGIINKPSRLDEAEFAQIKRHPVESFNLLDVLPRFEAIRRMAHHHHERWDGKGYPAGLKGEAIPYGARIIGIADTYDAMTSTRSYRKALPHETALEEIGKNAGSQFDPDLAAAFVVMANKIYPSRELLIAEESILERKRSGRIKNEVERNLASIGKKAVRADGHTRIIGKILSDDVFSQEIFRNSPVYYTIVDHDFNIIYASDKTARDLAIPMEKLLGMRCFEVNDKKMNCFRLDNGELKCPVVRAYHSGKEQHGTVVEKFLGQEMHFDIYAVPIDLVDVDGEPFRAMMEILVDRTKETRERLEFESSVKTLVDMLYRLAQDMNKAADKGAVDIVKECDTFGEYLSEMATRTREIAS